MNKTVKSTFEQYPERIRHRLLALRQLILDTAARIEGVGEIEETLKWSEPAYLTSQSGSGTTIRLNWKPAAADQYRMLFHCQTSVIDTCRTLFPELKYEGNRAIVFDLATEPPEDVLKACIEIALTYHSVKRKPRAAG